MKQHVGNSSGVKETTSRQKNTQLNQGAAVYLSCTAICEGSSPWGAWQQNSQVQDCRTLTVLTGSVWTHGTGRRTPRQQKEQRYQIKTNFEEFNLSIQAHIPTVHRGPLHLE